MPTAADRSTCRCKIHENLALKANRMKQLKLIETEDLDMLAAKVACDVGNKTCMYGECTICKNAQLPIRYTGGVTAQDEIWLWEWNSKPEEREKKGDKDIQDKYTVHFTIKEKVVEFVDHLVNEFCNDLPENRNTPTISNINTRSIERSEKISKKMKCFYTSILLKITLPNMPTKFKLFISGLVTSR